MKKTLGENFENGDPKKVGYKHFSSQNSYQTDHKYRTLLFFGLWWCDKEGNPSCRMEEALEATLPEVNSKIQTEEGSSIKTDL